jgi:hypothetical protein
LSVDLFVFLRRSDLPSTTVWQDRLDSLGIDVRLDPQFEATAHTGYWPAQLAGQVSGFEFYTGSISDGFCAPPPPGIDELDLVANS